MKKTVNEWWKHLIPHIAVVLSRYPLAIIAVIFFSSKDKLSLRVWKWLEACDWSLAGDPGWREEHLIGSDPLSIINRIRWLWRNGGNNYNYNTIGVPDNAMWRIAQRQGYGYFERPDGYWLKKIKVTLWGDFFIQLWFGWNILGPQSGRCKYVCTIRGKTED